jgi:hypothetical protein
MRFRNLEIFNLALLAKQGWRLIKNLTSMVAQILKEKYYPNGSFLDAQMGRAPSLAWQSIFKAQDLLQGSLRWRVGNGKNIKIWGDWWLPS